MQETIGVKLSRGRCGGNKDYYESADGETLQVALKETDMRFVKYFIPYCVFYRIKNDELYFLMCKKMCLKEKRKRNPKIQKAGR